MLDQLKLRCLRRMSPINRHMTVHASTGSASTQLRIVTWNDCRHSWHWLESVDHGTQRGAAGWPLLVFTRVMWLYCRVRQQDTWGGLRSTLLQLASRLRYRSKVSSKGHVLWWLLHCVVSETKYPPPPNRKCKPSSKQSGSWLTHGHQKPFTKPFQSKPDYLFFNRNNSLTSRSTGVNNGGGLFLVNNLSTVF